MKKKEGKRQKAGFPRLKGKGQYKSLTYTQSGFEILQNGQLELSKIGIIRMFKHREIMGEIKTLSISTDKTGNWYASFSVEENNLDFQPELTMNAVGIDAGLSHLSWISASLISKSISLFTYGMASLQDTSVMALGFLPKCLTYFRTTFLLTLFTSTSSKYSQYSLFTFLGTTVMLYYIYYTD